LILSAFGYCLRVWRMPLNSFFFFVYTFLVIYCAVQQRLVKLTKEKHMKENVKRFMEFEVFHGCDYEECRLLGCGVVWVYYKPTFRRNVSLPSSKWKKSASGEKC
jgi:hypothetical protein